MGSNLHIKFFISAYKKYKTCLLFFVNIIFFSFSIAWAKTSDDITFILPPSPIPFLLLTFLLLLFILSFLVNVILIRFILGDKSVKIPIEVKDKVEKTYIEKIKEEYRKKQEVLDNKIKEVRTRLAGIFIKVRNITTTLDPEKLFVQIHELLTKDLGVSKYVILLFDRQNNEIYPYRWQNIDQNFLEKLTISVKENHILTYSFLKKKPIYKLAAVDDPEVAPLLGIQPIIPGLIILPICTNDENLGLLYIEAFSDNRAQIEDEDIRFLIAISSFLGNAIQNANILIQTREELTSAKRVTEQEIQEKKKLKEIFSKYTSPELVDTILRNPATIKLGGSTKIATVLFSDIAGFTKFCSNLSPEQVVISINEYLSRMTEVILQNKGEIDKFIGDAIMARFGVLADIDMPAYCAVKAAVEMQKELKRMEAEWALRGQSAFSMRIGIATGPVLAGNIGSEKRTEFTVMGTTVNLASRLEALNKELASSILIDEATYTVVEKYVKAIPRENVSVRGLDKKVRVYEILGLKDDKK